MKYKTYCVVIVSVVVIVSASFYFSVIQKEGYQDMAMSYANTVNDISSTPSLQKPQSPLSTPSLAYSPSSSIENTIYNYKDYKTRQYNSYNTATPNPSTETPAAFDTTTLDYDGKSDMQGYSTFYSPYTFPYGPSTYVPSYEDSVYLSRTSDTSIVAPIVDVTSSMMGGFCTANELNPTLLEQNCNQLDTTVCASTNCCVLLGGSKCVSGNNQGVTMKSNYNDPSLSNTDYYYYQGKCYGNCFGV